MQNSDSTYFGKYLLAILGLTISTLSCNSSPKIIQPDRPIEQEMETSNTNSEPNFHEVTVNEFKHTEKYTYLNVTEDTKTFWIAVPRQEIEIGEVYYYQDGLRVQNFESKEFNRVFETLYLVSFISRVPMHTGQEPTNPLMAGTGNNYYSGVKIDQIKGGISLAELFSNPEQYEGEIIKVKGTVMKVNRRIMGRNWVHIQDGSGEEDLELTITTQEEVAVGSTVAFEGRMDRFIDFGSGYYYDIIMQEASLIFE